MEKTILEKWYRKGWLKYGLKTFNALDRLTAGRIFYRDYITSRIFSVGVIDHERPAVDGGIFKNTVESKLAAKDKFLKAYKLVPLKYRPMVEKIVLENKDIDKIPNKTEKKTLCEALDFLVCYYAEKKNEL